MGIRVNGTPRGWGAARTTSGVGCGSREAGREPNHQLPRDAHPGCSRPAAGERALDRQPLYLLGGVLGPEQATVTPEEVHRLEEAGAHGAAGDGKAEGVYEVACPLPLLGREAADRFFYRLLGPFRQGLPALDDLGEGLADELLAELLLELAFVVVEFVAEEVACGVRDLGDAVQALSQESHDLDEARQVALQLRGACRAGFGEHRGRDRGELLGRAPAEIDGVYGGELLLVEDRRVAAHAVDAEALGELGGGEDLLIRGGPRSQKRQVVEERLGQVTLRRELLDVRRAVTLGEFLLVRA